MTERAPVCNSITHELLELFKFRKAAHVLAGPYGLVADADFENAA